MLCQLSVCLLYLTSHYTLVTSLQIDDDIQEQTPFEKRRLDRYNFLGTLGKRQNEEISNERDLEEKRALDYRLFRGSLGKRNKDTTDSLDSSEIYPSSGYLDKETEKDGDSQFQDESNDEGNNVMKGYDLALTEADKRPMDPYMFRGYLGKRMDSRMFSGQLGKRALDRKMFISQLGKRLDNRMFFGRLGKRMDYRMFSGQLGKRGLDNHMFVGHLGKRLIPVRNSAYYYRYGSRGRPIYTQTRGMDRFSFAARLGKRDAQNGSSY